MDTVAEGTVLTVQNIALYCEEFALTVDGQRRIRLTHTELVLMTAFMASPRKVFSRESLRQLLLKKTGKTILGRGVDTLISDLRKKIGWSPTQGMLRTISGVGYALQIDS